MGSRLPPPCQRQSLGVDQWGQTVSRCLLEGVALLLFLCIFPFTYSFIIFTLDHCRSGLAFLFKALGVRSASIFLCLKLAAREAMSESFSLVIDLWLCYFS